MNLAPSSYYYQPKSDAEDQACRDAELKDHIERIQETKDHYIRPWGIYPPSNMRSRCNQPKLLIALTSNSGENSPAGGAQSKPPIKNYFLGRLDGYNAFPLISNHANRWWHSKQ